MTIPELPVTISVGESAVSGVYARPGTPTATLVVAHGAGAGMEHPFLAGFTRALNALAAEQGAKALVNLASEEYFKSVKPKQLDIPVITPQFEDYKGGKYKIISFYAKRARGLMARYAAVNAIRDPEQLKQFDIDGYAFEPGGSDQRRWLFRRRLAD